MTPQRESLTDRSRILFRGRLLLAMAVAWLAPSILPTAVHSQEMGYPPQGEFVLDEAGPVGCEVGCDAPCDDTCGWNLGDCWEGPAGACPPLGMLAGRLYFEADYLLTWTEADRLPPLVTTANTVALTPLPTGTVLFGGGDASDDLRSGARFKVGAWLDPTYGASLEVGYLFLGDQTAEGAWDDQDFAVLARPYFDLDLGQQASHVVADVAAGQTGSVSIREINKVHAVEALLRLPLLLRPQSRFDLTLGYRYARLEDDLVINEAFEATVPPASVAVSDQFLAENNFHGAVLGLGGEFRRHRWTLRSFLKLGIGSTHQRVTIDGQTQLNAAVYPVGLLALGSNDGVHERSVMSVVPELGMRVGYNFTPRLSGTIGCTFLYWSEVVRAGSHVETSLDPDLFAPPLDDNPPSRFAFRSDDFWARGLTLGLDYRF